jgi:hypothetical protein
VTVNTIKSDKLAVTIIRRRISKRGPYAAKLRDFPANPATGDRDELGLRTDNREEGFGQFSTPHLIN